MINDTNIKSESTLEDIITEGYRKGILRFPPGTTFNTRCNDQNKSKNNNVRPECQAFNYQNGIDVKQDIYKAVQLYQEAINNGHVPSMHSLAYIYQNHIIDDPNVDNYMMAISLYRQAANKGHIPSKFSLGLMYEKGKGVQKNIALAIELFEEAGEKDYPQALYVLGNIYGGTNVSSSNSYKHNKLKYIQTTTDRLYYQYLDVDKAIFYYKRAYSLGHYRSLFGIGSLYYREGNYKLSIEYLELYINNRSVTDLYTITESNFMLGSIYEKREQYDLARIHYKKTVTGEHSDGIINLASLLIKGLGGQKDLEEGCSLYKILVTRDDPRAIHNLGYAYQHGLGVEKNIPRAIELYVRGVQLCYPPSMRILGKIYLNNHNIINDNGYPQQDREYAATLFKIAAERDDIESIIQLGIMYETGKGVPRNLLRAIEYYQKGVEEGNNIARYQLGIIYLNDYNKKKEGVELLKTASEDGYRLASFKIACNLLFDIDNGSMEKDLSKKCCSTDTDSLHDLLSIDDPLFDDIVGVHIQGSAADVNKHDKLIKIIKDISNAKYQIVDDNLRKSGDHGFYLRGLFEHYRNDNIDLALKYYSKDNCQIYNVDAHYRSGLIYEEKGDNVKAVDLYKLGIENCYPPSMCRLAGLLSHDLFTDTQNSLGQYTLSEPVDINLNRSWKTILMDGNISTYHTSIELYRKAAELKYGPALYKMGNLYQMGKGVNKDLNQSLKYYIKASNVGYIKADITLGHIYENELNDMETSIKHYNRAAEVGDRIALVKMGLWYRYGFIPGEQEINRSPTTEVESKKIKAKNYFQRAVELDVESGYYHLGNIMLEDDNKEKAIELYNKSANKGYKPAIIKLKSLIYQNENPPTVSLGQPWVDRTEKRLEIILSDDDNMSTNFGKFTKVPTEGSISNNNRTDSSIEIDNIDPLCSKNEINRKIEDVSDISLEDKSKSNIDRSPFQDTVDVISTEIVSPDEITLNRKNTRSGNGNDIKIDKYNKGYIDAYYKMGYDYPHNIPATSLDKNCHLFYSNIAYKIGTSMLKSYISNNRSSIDLNGDNRYNGIIYLEAAASDGHIKAMKILGKIYSSKRYYNPNKSFKYYQMAADKDDIDSIFKLGKMFLNGVNIETNWGKAYHYFDKGVQRDHPPSIIKLGYIYEHSIGKYRDLIKAAECYNVAAEKGEYIGYVHLGYLYEYGIGVDKDVKEAERLYRLAVDHNLPAGINRLAKILEQQGSKYEAFDLYNMASDLGYPKAIFCLAKCYENGIGTDKDLNRALILYSDAAKKGHKDAINCMCKIVISTQDIK